MPTTLAIVTARAGSKRLPNKNYRLFLGKPLVMWSLEFALDYRGFDLVLVSTDSTEVAELGRTAGAYVPWMRPSNLASDTSTSVDVVMHAVDAMNAEGRIFDRVALLQPTSPVRDAKRWDEASKSLDQGAAAALGVSQAVTHPYWTYLMGMDNKLSPFCSAGMTMRSQDLPLACVPNGSLYLCDVDNFRQHRTLTPPGTCGVLCSDPIESIDIDTDEDWQLAERLVSERFKRSI